MPLDAPKTSDTLLDRLMTGKDAAAWDEFLRVYGGPLLRLFRQFGANAQDADALCQDVLGAIAMRFQRNSFVHVEGSFRRYLYRSALNAYIKHAKKLRKRPVTGAPDGTFDSAARVAGGKPAEPADHVNDLHFRWFIEETVQSAVRRALDLTRAESSVRAFRAFELAAVTVEARPAGEAYLVDLDRSDSEVIGRAAKELGWTNERVTKEKSEVKQRFVAHLRGLLAEEV